jgi:hypothetical protein
LTSEYWQPDAVDLAKAELIKRGIPIDIPLKRRESKIKYKKRVDKIKSNAEYSGREKILIVLFGPILFAIFEDFTLFDAGEGFRKKNRQGVIYLLLGLIIWITIFLISV